MRIKTFTAPDMPSAMSMVREALGDDAIILATESKPGRKQVTVTAAIEDEDDDATLSHPPLRGRVREGGKADDRRQMTDDVNSHHKLQTKILDLRFELQNILRFHNIPEIFVAKILRKLPDSDIAEIASGKRSSQESLPLCLEKLLSRNFVFDPLRLSASDTKIMLVGTPGIGKTLTVAKLATKLAMDKQALAVITTDTSRAGGIEQLQALTDILGIKLQVADNAGGLKKLLNIIPSGVRVLIDTAGCSPYNRSEFSELESIANLPDIEPILVLPAGGDALETIDALEIFAKLPIRRLFITRADATRRFGSIISAAFAHGLGFCNISRSSSITDTVQAIEPRLLTQLLLKYK